ncbi:MAG: homoserine kinase [Pseudomonadota bacterium]
MAVYTHVGERALKKFLARYALGALRGYKGIAQGVENSNYLLETERGRYILTLYERRVARTDLPFFLGLMRHLAARNIPCPLPIADRRGGVLQDLAGKPAAIVSHLDGAGLDDVAPHHLEAVGAALARLHHAGADFTMDRANDLSLAGWRRLAAACGAEVEKIAPGLGQTLDNELAHLAGVWPRELPHGVIHADLFPDNVFFLDGALSGLIDFYFACRDILAYDLAITVNAWCFDAASGAFKQAHAAALCAGYQSVRALETAERAAMPTLLRGAALRFLLTRAYDWLNPRADALVRPKDPLEYRRKLDFWRDNAAAAMSMTQEP